MMLGITPQNVPLETCQCLWQMLYNQHLCCGSLEAAGKLVPPSYVRPLWHYRSSPACLSKHTISSLAHLSTNLLGELHSRSSSEFLHDLTMLSLTCAHSPISIQQPTRTAQCPHAHTISWCRFFTLHAKSSWMFRTQRLHCMRGMEVLHPNLQNITLLNLWYRVTGPTILHTSVSMFKPPGVRPHGGPYAKIVSASC
jgi:hypothetical protein